MRLYLSSRSVGLARDELTRMLGPGSHVGVILNALDFLRGTAALAARKEALGGFADLGWRTSAVDLSRADTLNGLDGVWAVGGSCFLLARALADARATASMVARVRDGSLVYGGSSAGACVAGKNLRPLALGEDPRIVSQTYRRPVCWRGLGLLDEVIVPHHQENPGPREIDTPAILAAAATSGLRATALADGDNLVLDGRARGLWRQGRCV